MRFLKLLSALAIAGCASSIVRQQSTLSDAELLDRARDVHQRIITIDTHDDIPLTFATPEVDPLNADRQVNLTKMKAGGLDVAFFIVFVGQTPRTAENYERAKADAMTKFNAIHRMTKTMYPDRIELAYSPADVVRIHDSGKLVAAIGIENGYVIGKDLSLIKTYFDLGARYMTLAHGQNNDLCDSSTDQRGPEHNGVSAFGRQVVAEMNRVGMMVDISHVSKDCMMQATAMSKAPVVASHSSTRAYADVPRNLDDEQLRAIRKNGGVAQMVALAGFVKVNPPAKVAAIDTLRRSMGITGGRGALAALSPEQRAEYGRRLAEIEAKWPGPNVADFVNHIDHAVTVAGIDHVGISSDFDGGGGIRGWRDASETMNVTAELIRRGYSEAQIRKLWGGNFLRVWTENQLKASYEPRFQR
ncbi:MAG: dipeptidase [Gemmatimonadaceae bacterium]